jgi:hypothetical protein
LAARGSNGRPPPEWAARKYNFLFLSISVGIKEKSFFKWRQKPLAILPALASAEVSRHADPVF